MKKCTFSPEFSSRKQSEYYLRNRTDYSILNNQSSMNNYASRYDKKSPIKKNVSPQFGTKRRDYS